MTVAVQLQQNYLTFGEAIKNTNSGFWPLVVAEERRVLTEKKKTTRKNKKKVVLLIWTPAARIPVKLMMMSLSNAWCAK